MPKIQWSKYDVTGQLEIAAMLALTDDTQPFNGRYLSAVQHSMSKRLDKHIEPGAAMACLRRLEARGLVERVTSTAPDAKTGQPPNRYRATVSLVRLQHAALERLARTWFGGNHKRMAQAATHLANFGAVLGNPADPIDNHQ